MSDQCDGLAFRDGQIDVFQHGLGFVVGEADIPVGDGVSKFLGFYGFPGFQNRRFGFQYVIDTVHGRQSFLNAVKSVGQILRRIDDGVEQGDVGNEFGSGECPGVVEYQCASEPQNQYNHDGA